MRKAASRATLIRHSCGEVVLRIVTDAAETRIVNPRPILPSTDPLEGYENWLGTWHHVRSAAGNTFRGYPIHPLHVCPANLEKER